MLSNLKSTTYKHVGTVVKCCAAIAVAVLLLAKVPGHLSHDAAGLLALADLALLLILMLNKHRRADDARNLRGMRGRVSRLAHRVHRWAHCLDGGLTTWLALNFALSLSFAPTHALHAYALLLGVALVALDVSLTTMKTEPTPAA